MFKVYRIFYSEYMDNCTWRFSVDVRCINEKLLIRRLAKVNSKRYTYSSDYLKALGKKFKIINVDAFVVNVGYPNIEINFQGYNVLREEKK